MTRILLIAWTGFFLLTAPLHMALADNDAPHNSCSNLSCGSCHGATGVLDSSPFWGGGDDEYDNLCLSCHDALASPYTDTSSPQVKTHSSANTSTDYGTWAVRCIDCHSVHTHQQKMWKSTDAAQLFLMTGQITGYTYNSGPKTSTLNTASTAFKSGWTDTSKFQAKSTVQRNTVIYPNLKKTGFNFTVIAINDPDPNTITVKGDVSSVYVYAVLPTNFGITLGQYIRQYIDVEGTLKPVKFFDRTGINSFAYDESGTATDPTPTGICQVCHTQTSHWQNDGTLAAVADSVHDSSDGSGCTMCHPHNLGFKTNYPDHYDVAATPYVTDYDSADDAKCISCHSSPNPKDYVVFAHNAHCDNCHDITSLTLLPLQTGPNGDATLHSDNYPADPNGCFTCHENGGAYTYGSDFSGANGHKVQDHEGIEGNAGCTGCHTGDIVTATYTHNDICEDCHVDRDTDGTLVDGSVGVATGDVGDASGHVLGTPSDCVDCHSEAKGGPGGNFDGGSHADFNHSGITGNAFCTGCHTGDIITATYTHNSTCTDCHTNIVANGTLIDGANGWGDATVHALGETNDCLDCHDVSVGGPGTDFDGGSHADYDHSGITGNGVCTGCHDGNIVTGANTHNSTCTDCHTNIAADGTLIDGANGWGDATVHALGESNDCLDCHDLGLGGPGTDFDGGSHADYDHSGIGGAAAHCTGCHIGAVVDVVHSSTTTGNNTAATCTDCHNDPLNADGTLLDGTEKTVGAGGPYGTTQVGNAQFHSLGTVSSCDTCHSALGGGICYFEDNRHQNRHSQLTFGFTDNCVNCHDSSGAGTETYLIATIHGNDCQNCHNATTHIPEAKTNGSAAVGIGGGTFQCLGCHGGQGGTDNYTTFTNHDQDHDSGDGGNYLHHGDHITKTGMTSSPNYCTDCHDVSDGGTGIIANYHQDICTTCHVNITTNGSLVDGTTGGPAGTTSVGNATAVTHGSASTCTTCHTIDTNGTRVNGESHGLTAANVDGLSVHDDLTGSTPLQSYYNDCRDCHTDMGSELLKLTKHMGTDSTVNCLNCHTVADDAVNSSAGSASARTVINSGKSFGGGSGTTITCEDCHLAKGAYKLHGLCDDSDTTDGIDSNADADGDTTLIWHDKLDGNSAGESAVYDGNGGTFTSKLSSYYGLKVSSYNCGDCHAVDPDSKAFSTLRAMQVHTMNQGDGYGDCLTCHAYANVADEITLGQGGTSITCEHCHSTGDSDGDGPSGQGMYQYDGERHHTTANAQSGNCTYCHADPRPATPTLDTGYAATAATSGTYDTGWITDYSTAAQATIPKQPACRMCHTNADGASSWSVDVQGGNGDHGYNILDGTAAQRETGLTVWANDYQPGFPTLSGGNTSASITADRVTQTVVHRIEPNSGTGLIQAYDLGACFGCHSVQIRHASPIFGVDYTTDVDANNHMPWDVLRYGPGRSIFGNGYDLKGSYDTTENWTNHDWTSNKPCDGEGCQTRGKDYVKDTRSSPADWGAGPNIDTLLQVPAHSTFNNFETLTGMPTDGTKDTDSDIYYFADISSPAATDGMHISSADWDGTDVNVVVYNALGSGQTMRLTYTGGNCDGATAYVDLAWNAGGYYEGACANPGGWTEGTDTVTVSNTTTATVLDTETVLVKGFTAASAAADDLDALSDDTAYLSVMANDNGNDIFIYSLDDMSLNANCSIAISGTQVAVTCGNSYAGATEFDYTIMDKLGGTSTATATITVAPNDPPTLTVNQPAGGDDSATVGGSWNINYDLADAEEVVTVAFYYDDDNSGLDGTLAANCSAAPEGTGADCAWDTTGVTPGDYYIYGITSDGLHSDVTDYSSDVVALIPPVQLLAAGGGSTENYSGTADSGNITYNIAGSASDNRLLVVSIAVTDTGTNSYTSSMSATYGGQALTEITEYSGTSRASVWMGYLDEDGIAAASSSILAFNNGTTGWDVTKVQIMTFKNVNQATPLIGTPYEGGNTSGASSLTTSSLTMGERDMPIYAAVSRNTGGHSVSTTASGTMTEQFEELSNSASHSSGYKADVTAATSGTVTVTFGGSDRCALAAAVLRNIAN